MSVEMHQAAAPVGVRGTVESVNSNGSYTFSKPARERIELVPGLGVAGDVHAGLHVRHRSRVKADPSQPNLRQVHLIQGELFDEVGKKGYEVPCGGLGENITTAGIDLLGLPCGTILRFGQPAEARHDAEVPSGTGSALDVLEVAREAELDEAVAGAVEVLDGVIRAELGRESRDGRAAVVLAGLRNPCEQINGFRPGLLKEMVGRDGDGNLVRKAGVMGVVLRAGEIRPGDTVSVELPAGTHRPMDRV
jgi:MOSC domain-containing protein YiiM